MAQDPKAGGLTVTVPHPEVKVHVPIDAATSGTKEEVAEGLADTVVVGEGLAVTVAVGVTEELAPIDSVGVEVAVFEGVRDGVGVGVTGVPDSTTPLYLKVPPAAPAVLAPKAKQKPLRPSAVAGRLVADRASEAVGTEMLPEVGTATHVAILSVE